MTAPASALAPRPLPDWFARAELAVLRTFAAISLLLVLGAVAVSLASGTHEGPARTLGLAGVACMLATPFLRLLLLIAAFIAVRDRLYVALSIVILTVLFAGFLGG